MDDQVPLETVPADPEEYLRQAGVAAANGDVNLMLVGLHKSMILDGLKRFIQAKYQGALGDDEVDWVIATSVDQVVQYIRQGRKVLRLEHYLTKVALGNAYDHHREKEREVALDETSSGVHVEWDAADDYGEAERERRWKQAFERVRGLIPQIRMGTARTVMEYIFDRTAAGVQDITNEEIAEATGKSPAVVATAKHRGFERLRNLAAQAGLTDAKFAFDSLGPDDGVDQGETYN